LPGGIPVKASGTSKFRPTIPFFVGPTNSACYKLTHYRTNGGWLSFSGPVRTPARFQWLVPWSDSSPARRPRCIRELPRWLLSTVSVSRYGYLPEQWAYNMPNAVFITRVAIAKYYLTYW